MIVDLQEMVVDAITSFGKRNNVTPARIIFFRDGLSEGEYEKATTLEIKAIEGW